MKLSKQYVEWAIECDYERFFMMIYDRLMIAWYAELAC